MGSNRSNNNSCKERLKWNKELHDMFEKAVKQIGGPDRATPKGILRAMGIPGLTIFHVKSHLQKYRMSVFTREEDHMKTKPERKNVSEILPNFSTTSGAQLLEALRLHKEAYETRLRRLSGDDQNQVQKSLRQKLEEQERYMDRILEEGKNPNNNTYKSSANNNVFIKLPYSPIFSLPSLSEEEEEEESDDQSTFHQCSDSEEDLKDEIIRGNKRLKLMMIKDPTINAYNSNNNQDIISYNYSSSTGTTATTVTTPTMLSMEEDMDYYAWGINTPFQTNHPFFSPFH